MADALPKGVRDLSGQPFGRLRVLHFSGQTIHGAAVWTCECECGNRKDIRGASLTKRDRPTLSCGCLQRHGAARHNYSKGRSPFGHRFRRSGKEAIDDHIDRLMDEPLEDAHGGGY